MQAFKLAVGRSYRLVDRLDTVPALPPFDGYVHLDYSQWIQVSLPVLMCLLGPHAMCQSFKKRSKRVLMSLFKRTCGC